MHLSIWFSKKALLEFLPFLFELNLSCFDKSMMTGTILNYLQKAFDTIEHDMLLQKLYAIGFLKHTFNLFKSYLSSRPFLVNLENNLNLHLYRLV